MEVPDYVQIAADRREINRRISAFVERKRQENEVRSLRHYFPFERRPGEPTCARTQCQCIRRIVCKRQPVGDEDQRDSSPGKKAEENKSSGHTCPEGVEERLDNLERHVALEPGKCVPTDVYSRIRRLEEKVLYLEGLSPEYFQPDMPGRRDLQISSGSMVHLDQSDLLLAHHPVQYAPNRDCAAKEHEDCSSVDDDDQDLSLEEIEERISKAHKALLLKKEMQSSS